MVDFGMQDRPGNPKTEVWIAETRGRLARQAEHARRIADAGHDPTQARELLANMQQSLDLVLRHAQAIARIDARGPAEIVAIAPRREAYSQIRLALGAMRAIARHSAETCADPAFYASMVDERTSALVRCHNMGATSPDSRADLEMLLIEELRHHGLEFERIEVAGPEVRLELPVAGAIAIAVHELGANALKFGAFSDEAGTLSLTWRLEEGRLCVRWQERRVRVIAIHPARKGFGRRWIEKAMPQEFGVETMLRIQPGGAICEFYVGPKAFSAP